MESTAQINVRMSRSLKQSGDEALALIGLSPTQAIRALWEKASLRGKDLEDVRALLRGGGEGVGHEQSRADDVLIEGWTIVERVFAEHGIDYGGLERPDDMPGDAQLLEEALLDRMAEKGLA